MGEGRHFVSHGCANSVVVGLYSSCNLPSDMFIPLLLAPPVAGAMLEEVPRVKPLPSGTPRIVMVKEKKKEKCYGSRRESSKATAQHSLSSYGWK